MILSSQGVSKRLGANRQKIRRGSDGSRPRWDANPGSFIIYFVPLTLSPDPSRRGRSSRPSSFSARSTRCFCSLYLPLDKKIKTGAGRIPDRLSSNGDLNDDVWPALGLVCAGRILFTGYAILDGFDLGVGALHLFTKTDEERRLMLNSIGPFGTGTRSGLSREAALFLRLSGRVRDRIFRFLSRVHSIC